MNVLVVGGGGFVGSHVVDALLEEKMMVTVFDRKPEQFQRPVAQVTYICGQLNDAAALETAFSSSIDAVIHLASATVPKTSNDNPMQDVESVNATLGLLNLCVKFRVKRIVFASSGGTVYGIPESLPIGENHPTDPICSYGIGKLAVEKYLQLYDRLYSCSSTILRIANPYGTRQSFKSTQGVIPVFMNRILEGKPITIWGDGSAVRDFVSVRDVAKCFLLALKSDAAGIFNVGSGIGTSINELVQLLSSIQQLEPVIVREQARNCDVPNIVLDCRKAKAVYGWEPQVTLSAGLTELAHRLESLGSSPMRDQPCS
jgi:UDP-glucose 4-epimerase